MTFGYSPFVPAVAVLGLLSVSGAQERVALSFEKGRVTAHLQDSAVRPFLDEVSSRTQVAIVVAEEIGDDFISAELQDTPLAAIFTSFFLSRP